MKIKKEKNYIFHQMQEHFLMKHIKIFFEASCNKGAFIMPKNRKEHI